MAEVVTCRACGAQPRAEARFCDACGARIEAPAAEYKQVTVLFADVVRSMDLASTLDAEGLREVMADLFDRSAAVVRRYGGTVDKFTGDGIMAVFGAPITLEDHALRACLAALDIQKDIGRKLALRVGLNSGQVIAGDVGSATANYTTVGEQVGMAQRMETAAPPGGVMLSESTARLVESMAVLGEPEPVHVKNIDEPVYARRLLSAGDHHPRRLTESRLVGRSWELNTFSALLGEVVGGVGCVVGVVGPPGIGKSRLVRETVAAASARGVEVFSTYCESHTSDIPFHVVARLLRAATGIDILESGAARAQLRAGLPNADSDDLLLFEDLLGIRDPEVALPEIASDARRRRLTALLNSASLARTAPSVYVIEDAHWIDESSESMFAEFFKVIPQTPSLVLITYRPEYQGPLSRVSGGQTIGLRPLNDSQIAELTAELLGPDPSVAELAALIGARAAGNPFFVEEMLRDVLERGLLLGTPGAYQLSGGVTEVYVPATLQATIGARIDRLDATAKHALNAAAVIGLRFSRKLLDELVENANLTTLVDAELLDQVRFTEPAEFAFRHPLIRTVAYESQLKADRAFLHRRLAEIIEARGSDDESAALIAEHAEAAGDLRTAYEWHMRAGNWGLFRDITAARTSWLRAREVADQLPGDDPDRMALRIAPRTLLCGTSYRGVNTKAEADFDDFRKLCSAAGDERSLVAGMAGLVTAHSMFGRREEASRLATELVQRLESLDDSTYTIGLSFGAAGIRLERGEIAEVIRLSQRVIDLAEEDPSRGSLLFGSPLAVQYAFRGAARACMNIPGWEEDLQRAATMARGAHPAVIAAIDSTSTVTFTFHGMRLPDAAAVRRSGDLLSLAEQTGEDFAFQMARTIHAQVLAHRDDSERQAGLQMLAALRKTAIDTGFGKSFLPVIEIEIARASLDSGDLDAAIVLSRTNLDTCFETGWMMWAAPAAAVLVEALLKRGGEGDLDDARKAVDTLAAVPTDPGFVLNEPPLLHMRALLAQAAGDMTAYREYRDSYRNRAKELGFEGHIAIAEAMP